MKKTIATLLLAVMCLTLVACGGQKSTDGYIGTWENDSYLLVVNKDKTGTLTSNKGEEDEKVQDFTWVFDEATRTLILTSEEDGDSRLTYLEVNDTLVSSFVVFERAE